MPATLKSLSDIESFSVTRNQFYEIANFDASGRISFDMLRGEKQRKQALEKFAAEDKTPMLTTITFYDFSIKFNDGTPSQEFSVNSTRLEDFYSKKIIMPYGDYQDQVFHMYDSIFCLKLNSAFDHLKTVQIEMPLQLLKDEIEYLNLLPLPEEMTTTTTVKEITQNVISFWKPAVNFNWGSGAYELYSENRNKSAQNNRTLTDLVDSLHTMARNYSKNQNNPSYLNIFKDSDDDFVWSIQNADKRTVFNGGIIFHRDYENDKPVETGHYSIHT